MAGHANGRTRHKFTSESASEAARKRWAKRARALSEPEDPGNPIGDAIAPWEVALAAFEAFVAENPDAVPAPAWNLLEAQRDLLDAYGAELKYWFDWMDYEASSGRR